MWLSDILDKAIDGALGLVLPDEVVEQVVDPMTDALGVAIDVASGRLDKAAQHSLALAEDFAQWAGNNDLAQRLDQLASSAGQILGPTLMTASSDQALAATNIGKEQLKAAASEAVLRAGGFAAGAAAGGVITGDLEGAGAYGKMGTGLIGGAARAKVGEMLARAVGAGAGAGVGAALGGERGARLGLSHGGSLGGNIGALTRDDVVKDAAGLGAKVVGVATQAGGIAAGMYLADEWSVAQKGAGRRRNLAAFQWAAGAGATAGGLVGMAVTSAGKADRAKKAVNDAQTRVETVIARHASGAAKAKVESDIERSTAGRADKAGRTAGASRPRGKKLVFKPKEISRAKVAVKERAARVSNTNQGKLRARQVADAMGGAFSAAAVVLEGVRIHESRDLDRSPPVGYDTAARILREGAGIMGGLGGAPEKVAVAHELRQEIEKELSLDDGRRRNLLRALVRG